MTSTPSRPDAMRRHERRNRRQVVYTYAASRREARELSDASNQPKEYEVRGTGRATFAAILLLIAGTLNIIYGIGALDSANIFVNDTRYIFTDLNTMGWVLIVLGLI